MDIKQPSHSSVTESTKIGNRETPSHTGGIVRDPDDTPYIKAIGGKGMVSDVWKDPRRIT